MATSRITALPTRSRRQRTAARFVSEPRRSDRRPSRLGHFAARSDPAAGARAGPCRLVVNSHHQTPRTIASMIRVARPPHIGGKSTRTQRAGSPGHLEHNCRARTDPDPRAGGPGRFRRLIDVEADPDPELEVRGVCDSMVEPETTRTRARGSIRVVYPSTCRGQMTPIPSRRQEQHEPPAPAPADDQPTPRATDPAHSPRCPTDHAPHPDPRLSGTPKQTRLPSARSRPGRPLGQRFTTSVLGGPLPVPTGDSELLMWSVCDRYASSRNNSA
jgi:hypothetical protein